MLFKHSLFHYSSVHKTSHFILAQFVNSVCNFVLREKCLRTVITRYSACLSCYSNNEARKPSMYSCDEKNSKTWFCFLTIITISHVWFQCATLWCTRSVCALWCLLAQASRWRSSRTLFPTAGQSPAYSSASSVTSAANVSRTRLLWDVKVGVRFKTSEAVSLAVVKYYINVWIRDYHDT